MLTTTFFRKTVLFICLSIVLFSSCKKDEDTIIFTANPPHYDGGGKDYLNSNNYICWNDGDQVNINGALFTISVDNNNNATIAAQNVSAFDGHYYAAFPSVASISPSGTVTFSIPQDEHYTTTANGYQKISNPMCAHTTGSNLNFQNIGSLLQFTLTASGSDNAICAIEVEANAPICGDVTASYSGGTWVSNVSGLSGSHIRRLLFDTPVTLSSTAKSFYLVIPSVSGLSSFTVRFYIQPASGPMKVFERTKSASTEFLTSQIYQFPAVNYTGSIADYSDVSPDGSEAYPYLVTNYSSWKKVFASVGTDAKFISLLNDIDVNEFIDDFSGTLDGNDHTVNLTASVPVFKSLTNATIKNVVIVSENDLIPTEQTLSSLSNMFGVLVASSTATQFINCINHANVAITATSLGPVGGLCGRATGSNGLFENCKNYGNISVNLGTSTSNTIGGICGNSLQPIRNCSNFGNVCANSVNTSYIGGICGSISKKITACLNHGNVHYDFTGSPSQHSYVGGITGCLSGSLRISDCGNTGSVYHSVTNPNGINIYLGGIIGTTGTALDTIMNCFNEASINEGCLKTRTFSGGVCGYSNKDSILNCYVLGNIHGQNVGGISCDNNENTTVTNCYYYGVLDSSSYCGGVVCTKKTSTNVSYCHCPNIYRQCRGISGDLTAPITLSGGGSVIDALNAHIPTGGHTWTVQDGHVAFVTSKWLK